MKISKKEWLNYIQKLRKISAVAAQKMETYIDAKGIDDTQVIIDYAYALTTKYGEGAAEWACQMYDAIARAQRVRIPAAEPANVVSYREVTNAAYATKFSEPWSMPSVVGRMVRQAGADTVIKNAKRDGAEWAWIPNGDTCAFCFSLASRGWQHASKAVMKGDHAEHIHNNCDCSFAIRFDGRSEVEGYEPEKYLEAYNSAEGKSSQEKINALRRANYAKNADRIRAQKRESYRKLSEAKNGRKTVITDKTIENVPEVEIPNKSKEYNERVREINREVLRISKDENYGNEVAMAVSKTLKETERRKGDETGVGLQGMKITSNAYLVHNHPRNNSFSMNDIAVFVNNKNIESMAIVKNNGHVEVLTVTSENDRMTLRKAMRRAIHDKKPNNDVENDRVVLETLSKLKRKGVLKWVQA